MRIDYRIALTDITGSSIMSDVLGTTGVLAEAASVVLTESLDGPATFEFSLPVDDANVTRANFMPSARNIEVYREENLVFRGRLWTADLQGWSVRFSASDLSSLFEKWLIGGTGVAPDIDQVFLATDQYTLARSLLAMLQARPNGDSGITPADADLSGVLRDYAVCLEDAKTLTDVLDEFAGMRDGFDYWVTPDKLFHLSAFRGEAMGVTIHTEPLAGAVWDLTYQLDGSEVVSQVSGLGPQAECTTPALYVTEDAPTIASSGLLQSRTSTDQADDDIIQGLADEELAMRHLVRWQPVVTMPEVLDPYPWSAYQPGNRLTLTAGRGPAGGFGNFSELFRIATKTTTVYPLGIEVVSLALDNRTAPEGRA